MNIEQLYLNKTKVLIIFNHKLRIYMTSGEDQGIKASIM